MTKKLLIAAFAIALTVGLLASTGQARLIAGGDAYAFQASDSFDITIALASAGNADGQAQNPEDGCDEEQAPGEETETPSGVCYDPIRIGGSGS